MGYIFGALVINAAILLIINDKLKELIEMLTSDIKVTVKEMDKKEGK